MRETRLTGVEKSSIGAYRRRPPFLIDHPDTALSGVVFSSPHSGRAYFSEFLAASRLDLRRLRASEVAFIDDLFRAATGFGATLLSAVAPRAYVDLNRDPCDLDPALIDGVDGKIVNARVVAGLGVVPRIVAEGVSIYAGKLSLGEAKARIERWHAPYHSALAELLDQARERHGRALLIDCHSMPSEIGALSRRGGGCDIVLGDRFGAAADPMLMEAVESAFIRAGFRVARNTPFAGGYITERYGRPAEGVSAIQIEIDRALYLDQSAIEPSRHFDTMRSCLGGVIGEICQLVGGERPAASMAAE